MITEADIWQVARDLGLDPWETEFDVVPANIIYDVAARALPGRYSHWSYGKAYWRQKWSYDMGHSRIYELVVNTRPARAFLLEGNTELQQTLVKAHVLAHVDFFRHNIHFAGTERQMDVLASIRADRIAVYEAEIGRDEVENFLTACLAFEGAVDPDGWAGYVEVAADEPNDTGDPYAVLRRLEPGGKSRTGPDPGGGNQNGSNGNGASGGRGRTVRGVPARERHFQPTTDVLDFLSQSADLADWQRDLLSVVRAESLYFRPQMRTKIVNEGWASYWHQQMLRQLPFTDGEMMEFARLHAAITSPSKVGINPYHLGLVILRNIEANYGRDKLFEVRAMESDVSLLRNYLTRELVEDAGLFTFGLDKTGDYVVTESEDWKAVRDSLCRQLTDGGQPEIWLVDPDWGGQRELLLHHNHDGRDLDLSEASKVLAHLYELWGRPVHLETVSGGRRAVVTCNEEGADVQHSLDEVNGEDRWPGT